MRKRFSQFARAVLALNLVVIVWGALVRASQSGDGCGNHWPLCNGTVLPHAATIATLIEFTHRASTGLALFSVVAMAIWAHVAFRNGPVAKAAQASLILILTEALFGAGLVLMKYVGQDASTGRVAALSAHLINTFLMLGAMALTAWWSSGHPAPDSAQAWNKAWNQTGKTSRLLAIAIAAVLALGITGVVTALGDTLFPSPSLRAGLEADFSAASPWFLRVRIWHGLFGVLVAGYLMTIARSISEKSPSARRVGSGVIGLAALQVAAGVLNLGLLAPIWMQLIHLLLADLLWIALVLFSSAALEMEPSPGIGHQRKLTTV